METIYYSGVVDKSTWERGPWDNEPDKVQWQDDATGLPCLAVRGPHGAWCGYVGVSEGHPWFQTHYDDCGASMPKPDGYDESWYPDVHGGLTFSRSCSHIPEERGICHKPSPGEPDNVWWLGFDCAHAGDKTNMADSAEHRERWPHLDDVYRTLEYVMAECCRLAAQAMSAGTAETLQAAQGDSPPARSEGCAQTEQPA